mgnify:CR=1 FL=1
MSSTESAPVSMSGLASALRQAMEGSERLVLRGDTLGAQVPMRSLLRLLRADAITLASPVVTEAEDHLSLTGSATLYDLASLAVTLSIRATAAGLAVELQAGLPAGQTMALPGLPGLSLGQVDLSLAMEVVAGAGSAQGALHATVQLGDVAVPVTLPLPKVADGWIVMGKFPEADRPGLTALTRFVGAVDLPTLPEGLGDALRLSEFELVLQRSPYASFTIVAAPWEIIAGQLSISDIELQIVATLPGAGVASELSLRLQAMIEVGSVLLPVVFARASDGLGWALDMDTGQVPLPGIADLAAFLGGSAAFDTLFPGLSGFGGLALRNLHVELPENLRGLRALSFCIGTTAPWTLPLLPGLALSEATTTFRIAEPLSSATRAVTGAVTGTVIIGGLPFLLSGEKTTPGAPWQLAGRQLDEQPLSLTALFADLMGTAVPAGVPDFAFVDVQASMTPATGEFSLSGRSATPWSLPIGPTSLVVSDVELGLARSVVAGQRKTTTQVGGKIEIGGLRIALSVSLPGELRLTAALPALKLSDVVTTLCGENLLPGLGLPAELSDFTLQDGTLTLDPMAGSASLGGIAAGFGHFEIVVRKDKSGRWGLTMGILPSAGFSLGEVLHVPELTALRFSDMCLVLATASDPSFTFETARSFTGVSRGLTLMATLSLRELGLVDALNLAISQVAVRLTIGASPADLKLAAALNLSVPLGHGMVLRDPTLQLQVVPTLVGLTGTLDANLDGSPLTFSGGFLVRSQPPSAALTAKMLGDWRNPLGAQGLTVSDLAIDWNLPAGLPGIAGTIRLGGNMVALAVRFDAAEPMILAYLRTLDFGAIVSDLAAASGGMPTSLVKSLADIRLEEISLAIVPRAMHVDSTDYAQGMTLSVARLTCWGVVGTGTLISSPQNGMTLHALVNRFDVGDQLHVDGCQLDLALKPNTTPNIVLKGRASLLDIAADVDIAMSDAGFRFNISGAIFGQLRAALLVSGKNFPSGKDIQVQAQVDTAWLNQFKDSAALAVRGWGGQADSALIAAQQLVSDKQRDNAAYEAKIASTRAAIIAQRQRDQEVLAAARRDVESALAKVSALGNEINTMRATITAERERDQRRLDAARAALVGPQNDVNRLNDEINATNGWFYSLPKTDWPWKPSQAREGAWFGAKMAGLYTAREVATGVLNAAARTVALVQQGIAAFDINLDPRLVALTTAKATADRVLSDYNATLATAQAAIKLFPIEADPALLALTTMRDNIALGLVAAKEALAAVQTTLQSITRFAASVTAGALSIRSASFGASLAGMLDSSIAMSVTLDSGRTYTLDVNLHSAMDAAITLAKQVLGLDAPSSISAAQSRVQAASQADQLALAPFLPEGAEVCLRNVSTNKYVATTGDNEHITFLPDPYQGRSGFILHRLSDSSGTWMSFRSRTTPSLTLCVDGDLVLRGRAISATDANNPAIWFQLRGDTLYSRGAGCTLKFLPAASPLPIALIATNGWYVSAAYGGGVDVIANKYVLTSWETFRVHPVSGGVGLQVSNGQFICAEGGGGGAVNANRPAIGPWETFQLLDLGSGRVAIRTVNGNYLCAEDAGWSSFVANRTAIGAWETFQRIDLSKDELRGNPSGPDAQIGLNKIIYPAAGLVAAGGSSSTSVPIPSPDATTPSGSAPAASQVATEDATKSNVSASAAVGQKDAAASAAQTEAAQAKQAAVSTLVGVQEAQERAAAAAYAQSAMARAMAAAMRSMCVHFDGTGCIEVPVTRAITLQSSSAVTVAQTTTLQLAEKGTFECWLRRSERSPMIVMSKGQDAAAPECAVRVGTGLAFFTGQRWLPEAGELQESVWQHIAVSYDGSQVSYFIDGELVMRFSEAVSPVTSTQPLRIGQLGAQPTGDNFKGEIDEVRLWSTARTIAELRGNRYRTIHGATAGLLSCWRLDEGSGSSALEQTTVGNHGTLKGGARFGFEGAPPMPTALSSGLALDAQAYIEIPDSNLVPGIALTFEARVAVRDLNDDIVSIINKWSNDENDEYLFGIQRDGRLILCWQTTGGRSQAVSSDVVPLNRTVHVAVSRGGKTISFFIDGQPAGQSESADLQPFRDGPTTLRLGAQLRGPNRRLNGSLAEVKIWSIERRPEELLLTRDLPLSGREAGLAAYYRLDEGGGSTAFDQTTAGYHGQVIAGSPLMVGGGSVYLVNPGGDLLLYHHAADGSFDIGGARVGIGWGDFARVLSARDGHFYCIASDGTLLYYHHDASGLFDVQARRIGSGWTQFVWVGAARLGRLYALTEGGDLLLYEHDAAFSWVTQGRVLGGRWGGYRRLFTGGTGCLYAVTSDGVLLYNRHDAAGSWIQRGVSMGSGWDNYASLLCSGNGEVYAVKRNGDLCFHRHDANLTWLPGSGLRIGTGWAVYDPYSPLPSLTSGTASIGANSASVTPITTAVTPAGFPPSAIVLATPCGGPWPDTFVSSTVGVGPSTFAVNTVRVDSGDSVKTWGQSLSMNFLAFFPFVRARMQCGSIHVGPRDAQGATVRGYFPQAFAQVPRVLLTARSPSGSDTFAVSTCGITTTGFSARLWRADAARGSTQDVTLDCLAFDSLQDLAGIEAQSGTVTVGPHGYNTSHEAVVTVVFNQPFSKLPRIVVTPRGGAYDDAFAATLTSVNSVGFRVNIVRLDGSFGWGQDLQLDWLAVVPPAPGVVRSLAASIIVPGR